MGTRQAGRGVRRDGDSKVAGNYSKAEGGRAGGTCNLACSMETRPRSPSGAARQNTAAPKTETPLHTGCWGGPGLRRPRTDPAEPRVPRKPPRLPPPRTGDTRRATQRLRARDTATAAGTPDTSPAPRPRPRPAAGSPAGAAPPRRATLGSRTRIDHTARRPRTRGGPGCPLTPPRSPGTISGTFRPPRRGLPSVGCRRPAPLPPRGPWLHRAQGLHLEPATSRFPLRRCRFARAAAASAPPPAAVATNRGTEARRFRAKAAQ